MECETARELLGNYIDQDLTETLRGTVDEHVATCAQCKVDLTTLQQAISSLTGTKTIETPSPWFAERLLHRLAQESDTPLAGAEKKVEDLQLGLW